MLYRIYRASAETHVDQLGSNGDWGRTQNGHYSIWNWENKQCTNVINHFKKFLAVPPMEVFSGIERKISGVMYFSGLWAWVMYFSGLWGLSGLHALFSDLIHGQNDGSSLRLPIFIWENGDVLKIHARISGGGWWLFKKMYSGKIERYDFDLLNFF